MAPICGTVAGEIGPGISCQNVTGYWSTTTGCGRSTGNTTGTSPVDANHCATATSRRAVGRYCGLRPTRATMWPGSRNTPFSPSLSRCAGPCRFNWAIAASTIDRATDASNSLASAALTASTVSRRTSPSQPPPRGIRVRLRVLDRLSHFLIRNTPTLVPTLVLVPGHPVGRPEPEVKSDCRIKSGLWFSRGSRRQEWSAGDRSGSQSSAAHRWSGPALAPFARRADDHPRTWRALIMTLLRLTVYRPSSAARSRQTRAAAGPVSAMPRRSSR